MDHSICIMICTRQRPEMLRACLQSLLPQLAAARRGDKLVVIENDQHPASKPIVDEFAAAYPGVQIVYELEPRIGIPIARNRSMDVARSLQTDWLAFIDDDEVASAGWLVAMRQIASENNCAAITGPVIYETSARQPEWFSTTTRSAKTRGQIMRTAATNNTLVNTRWLNRHGAGLRFDETLRYTGGSDIDFFFRLADAGGRIIWVDDAIMRATLSPEHLKMQWHFARAIRVGANLFHIQKKRIGPFSAFHRLLAKAVGRAIKGAALLVPGLLICILSRDKGKPLLFNAYKDLAYAIGCLGGIIGVQPEPYRVVIGC